MFHFLKWQWDTASSWQKRNYLWFILLIVSLFSPYYIPTLVFGCLLIADSLICAVIESYQCYKKANENT